MLSLVSCLYFTKNEPHHAYSRHAYKKKHVIHNDILNLIKLKDKLYSKYIKEVNATTKLNILKEYKIKKTK